MTPSLPDTQERYPNDELVWKWGNEFANQWLRGQQSTLTREQYVARKACDWQRERDALICEEYAGVNHRYPFSSELLNDCASAIRTPPQPGAAQ